LPNIRADISIAIPSGWFKSNGKTPIKKPPALHHGKIDEVTDKLKLLYLH